MKRNSWYHITTGQIGYPQPQTGFGYIEQTYDTGQACPTCNIGLIQKAPFRFQKVPTATRSHFLGLNWVFDEIFVRQEVKNAFERENISGITFSQPVIHKSGMPVEEIYQIKVDQLISEGLITNNLTHETCELPKDEGSLRFLTAIGSQLVKGPFCGKIKYNIPRGNNCIRILSQTFANATDFVRLDHPFGSGGSLQRPIIVSEKVKLMIESHHWRGTEFQPIDLM